MDLISRREDAIHFVGEHDGEPERELKAMLCSFFVVGRAVQRAYLVRVRYGKQSLVNVALALVAAPESSEELVGSVNGVFHSLFDISQHLDVFFPTVTQEAEISAVCHPFFSRS